MQKEWFKNAVVYQIYPRSFQDSNADGIGDLRGIQQRLDYLVQLGVDVIWLNPIYQSPDVDNGYDISDYRKIQPIYGTMQDFDNLLAAVHQHHLKLMMDLVVNHTSDQHRWFLESKQSRTNPYADFYIWRDPVDGHAPNNWGSAFSGSAWTYVPERQQYYLHLFAREQPDLNWENKKVRQHVYEEMRFWLDKGIDGFRMDVINLISKPFGLPDAPQSSTALYGDSFTAVTDGPRLNGFLQEMNREVLAHYDIMTVGEMPDVTTAAAIDYANLNGKELDMVFQFQHVDLGGNSDPRLGKWNDEKPDLVDLKKTLSTWQTRLANKAWNSLYWNNHDQPRAVSRFGDDRPQYRELSAKMIALTLHGMQGTPYIYAGEEIGMTNVNFTDISEFEDIEAINAFEQLVNQEKIVDATTMLRYLNTRSRDHARTPMQWSDQLYSGFSTVQPYFALNQNYPEINVEKAKQDPNSVFYFYQKLIELRHQLPLLTYGTYQLLDPDDPQIFAYQRQYQNQTLFVISNFSEQTVRHAYSQEQGELLIHNYAEDLGQTLRPYESKMYYYQS
ncbi:glycoside hydrolase family 13 protein [Bombilactobacillus thymidiniphilus]|uniref:Alpha-glucosidase n=1 Tax=Bombilactobacillus thymidiniphilus TaxID=2923363 RepID=A0ABY4PEE4_9LACO|nr:alpha-glucosidase [Bombilactobacillus thymidiniphilus]UQS84095.1 alpha-glucosidase [Bombilactobacillus thymidiniphilus]